MNKLVKIVLCLSFVKDMNNINIMYLCTSCAILWVWSLTLRNEVQILSDIIVKWSSHQWHFYNFSLYCTYNFVEVYVCTLFLCTLCEGMISFFIILFLHLLFYALISVCCLCSYVVCVVKKKQWQRTKANNIFLSIMV
jgi:hypothetical protein